MSAFQVAYVEMWLVGGVIIDIMGRISLLPLPGLAALAPELSAQPSRFLLALSLADFPTSPLLFRPVLCCY